jgi:hypothetical protein
MDENKANRVAHEPDLNLLAAECDGKLGNEESAKLAAHLAECRACRETAARMARALAAEPARRPGTQAIAGWLALAATLVLASIVGIRISREQPSVAPSPRPASRPTAPAAVLQPPEPTSAIAAPGAPAAAAAEPPDVKRGGERRAAGKTFRLVAGEWVDRAYDPTAGLPVVEVSDPEARRGLLAKRPDIAPCLELGDRVLLVLDGTVYRVGPAGR